MVPMRRGGDSALFPSAFLASFRRFLRDNLECQFPNSKVIGVDQFDAQPLIDETLSARGASESNDHLYFIGAALVAKGSSTAHLQCYHDLLRDQDGTLESFVGIIFEKSSASLETSFSVLTMYTRTDKQGSRMGSKLLATCLLDIMDNPLFCDVDWSAVQVNLDDCTEVDPPRNLYYCLGFQVWSNMLEQFVSWNQWMDQDYNLATCPNPDERRRIGLRDLLWNLSQFLGFRS